VWVSQTYLGKPDPDAEIFVYYLFERYDEQQRSYTEALQPALSQLGRLFGSKVSLFLPDPFSAEPIEAELRSSKAITPEMWGLQGALPGFLLSRKALRELTAEDEVKYLRISASDPGEIVRIVAEVRRLVTDQLDWNYAQLQDSAQEINLLERGARRIWRALIMKPTVPIVGIGLDVKELLRRDDEA